MTSQIIAQSVAAEFQSKAVVETPSRRERRDDLVKWVCWAVAAVAVLVLSLVVNNPLAAELLAVAVFCYAWQVSRRDEGDQITAATGHEHADYYMLP